MLLNPISVHLPTTKEQAAHLFGTLTEARVLAGGTFVMNTLKLLKTKGNKTPQHLISLVNVKELKGISQLSNQLTIGAMTSITDLYESPLLTGNASLLKIISRNISTTPIRNMASVGGNLTCRYTWTDLPVAMLALKATLHFMKADGTPTQMSAEDFFKNAARCEHLLTHVTVPLDTSVRVAYQRVRKMSEVDQPLLSLAATAKIQNGKIIDPIFAINATTSFAQRDYALEQFLNGQKADRAIINDALTKITTTIYDTRSSEYKQHMFRVCIAKNIETLIA